MIIERIPHPKIAYAYLELHAESFNEFEKLRAEALKKHPLYSESAFERKNVVAAAEPEVTSPVETGSDTAAGSEVDPATDTVTPAVATPTEGLSPRDKAKAALAAKKGA